MAAHDPAGVPQRFPALPTTPNEGHSADGERPPAIPCPATSGRITPIATIHKPYWNRSWTPSRTDGEDMDPDDGEALDDSGAWAFQAPPVDPYAERLTLALLEDLSRLLVVHGYPPLRGHALAELAVTLQRLQP